MSESSNMKNWAILLIITVLIFNSSSFAKYSGGTGEPNDPYKISTYQDLINLGNTPEDYNDCFVMTNDIDLDPKISGHKVFDNAVISPDIDGKVSFSGTPFAGAFDGNGYTISNLTIEGESFLGLFGSLKFDSEVKNLRITDVNIIGSGYHIGSLVGNNCGNLINCSCDGSVKGYWYVGGLIGDDRGGYIDSCSYSGFVGGYWEVGGLTGGAGPGRGVITGIISNSYSISDVNGTGPYIGGLVGYNSSNIIQCYCIGDINGNESVGGLVGINMGIIKSSYSSGKIIGNDKVGGLVGENFEDIESCFWDIEDSNTLDGVGNMDPDPNSAMGRTTSEMQIRNTFTDEGGWDFIGEAINGPNDIWWILEGKDYPRLWWQLPEDDFNDCNASPLWVAYEPEPGLAHLEELNGRLEVNTAGAMEDVDAIYIPYNWALDANEPFSIQVDFHFSKIGIGDGRINIGIVPSLDPSANKWVDLEAGTFDDNPFYLYEIRDGVWEDEQICTRFLEDGTLFISYDPNSDELYFSNIDYGEDDAIWTIEGLLHAQWQAESIYIILSGGSEDGMALTGEDAWLDNFKVHEGVIQQ